ncbi:MAG: type VI secretion system contractile sheath small subunit [Deltaproteobacteria bacterium]|jgi:type VI secretion system protein ImpB|nr:type VI secretion system contractile sheath small subunit [Deltaproteobacteria bacterium]
MAKAAIPNRERVNIVYKSQLENGQDIELPFKLLVLGDFSQASQEIPLDERSTIKITKENFDAVLKGMKIKLDLLVENRLTEVAKEPLRLRLELNSLADFGPDHLVRQISPLKKLVDLSQALVQTKKTLNSRPGLFNKLTSIMADKEKKTAFLDELLRYNDQLDAEESKNISCE